MMNEKHITTESLTTFESVVSVGESEPETVFIKINVPLTVKLWRRRSLTEYKRIALDTLRNQVSALFDNIEFLSVLPDQTDVDFNRLRETFIMSAFIGKGLIEAMEAVETDFERFMEKEKRDEK